MEILDLRHLTANDLEPLLEEEIGLWNRMLLWDYHASADLIRRFLDSRSLPGFAAIERGQVAGYAFFVYEEHKGLIGDLYVMDAYRGQVEDRLLSHVVETLRGSPGIQRIEAQLMMLAPAQLERAFRGDHFQAHPRKFLYLDLKGPSARAAFPQAARKPADFIYEQWEERHFEEAAALITRAYRDHVDSAINDQYRSLSGALRFLRNITQYPGCGSFHTQASIAAIHKPTRRMQALILTSTVNPGVGHITQVCTSPEFRNAGLGYELVRRATEIFQAQNYSGISLTVTTANTRAVDFYDRLGFRTLRDFKAYVWDSSWI